MLNFNFMLIISNMFQLMASPFNQAFERQLQTVAIVHWTFSMFLGGFFGLFACAYLLFTPYSYLVIAYFVWIYYDRNTCKQGGRRSKWVRNWSLWKCYRDYFPIRLIKSVDLNKDRNYVFGCHPHGVLSIGAYCNFATEATNFSQKFPGIVPHLLTLSSYFCFPFVREYFAWTGVCCSSKESFNHILTKKGKGNAVAVIVGGVAEALTTKPNRVVFNLKNRKGFVKLAICNGADLVPVISFGENDTFNLNETEVGQKSWLSRMRMKLYTIMGLCPPLFYYFCFWRCNTFGLMPDRKAIVTVVGKPIEVVQEENPSQETIERYHKLYTENLQRLFDEYKHKLGGDFKDLSLTMC